MNLKSEWIGVVLLVAAAIINLLSGDMLSRYIIIGYFEDIYLDTR